MTLWGDSVEMASGRHTSSLSLRSHQRVRAFPCLTQGAEGFAGTCSVGAAVDVVVARLVAHLVDGLGSL